MQGSSKASSTPSTYMIREHAVDVQGLAARVWVRAHHRVLHRRVQHGVAIVLHDHLHAQQTTHAGKHVGRQGHCEGWGRRGGEGRGGQQSHEHL
jgi:hypothetical protein